MGPGFRRDDRRSDADGQRCLWKLRWAWGPSLVFAPYSANRTNSRFIALNDAR
jgi:hypothetical protein